MSAERRTDAEYAYRNRLLWRCRRGLLELDLVLVDFVERHFDALDVAQQEQFLALLELPDNELLDLITSKVEAKAELRPLLNLLIAA